MSSHGSLIPSVRSRVVAAWSASCCQTYDARRWVVTNIDLRLDVAQSAYARSHTYTLPLLAPTWCLWVPQNPLPNAPNSLMGPKPPENILHPEMCAHPVDYVHLTYQEVPIVSQAGSRTIQYNPLILPITWSLHSIYSWSSWLLVLKRHWLVTAWTLTISHVTSVPLMVHSRPTQCSPLATRAPCFSI